MRCHICDNNLSETEVHFNELHQDFDPCRECLYVIRDLFNDDDDEHDDTLYAKFMRVAEERLDLYGQTLEALADA